MNTQRENKLTSNLKGYDKVLSKQKSQGTGDREACEALGKLHHLSGIQVPQGKRQTT